MEQKYPEPTVGALILNPKGQILLVKSYKWPGKYTIPGGHIEVGETVEEALKREVKEEVGLDVEFDKVLFVQEPIYSKEFIKKKHFIFLECVCRAKSEHIKLDEDEIQEFIWVEPKGALGLDVDSFTRKFVEKYIETLEGK